MLHGGKLLAKVGLTGRFGCLGGELIDLRGQTIDLPLELLVLGRQRTIAFLCLGKLGGRGLSGLSGLVSRTSYSLGGGLQRRVLLLQGMDLSIQLGILELSPATSGPRDCVACPPATACLPRASTVSVT